MSLLSYYIDRYGVREALKKCPKVEKVHNFLDPLPPNNLIFFGDNLKVSLCHVTRGKSIQIMKRALEMKSSLAIKISTKMKMTLKMKTNSKIKTTSKLESTSKLKSTLPL